jgi:hypothetical protein
MTQYFRDIVELDSGLLIPASAAVGKTLKSDAAGNAAWIDDSNDALQPGVLGSVASTGVTAAVSVAGVLTFSQWPTNDTIYFRPTGGPLIRGSMGAAPVGLTLGAITVGYAAYIAVDAVPPTTPGGACTYVVSQSAPQATYYLASSPAQFTAVAAGNIRIWDAVVVNTSGVGITVATGTQVYSGTTPVPQSWPVGADLAQRDRRPWARGFYNRYERTTGNYNSAASTPAYVDSANMVFRFEATGKPFRASLQGLMWSGNAADGQYMFFSYWLDQAAMGGATQTQPQWGMVNPNQYNIPVTFIWDFLPTPGSHIIAPVWWNPNGTSWSLNGSAPSAVFSLQEIMAPAYCTNGEAF